MLTIRRSVWCWPTGLIQVSLFIIIFHHAKLCSDLLLHVIYGAPEVTTVPLETRAAWIRTLYPSVEVILAKDGPTVVGDAPEITHLHDAYLRQLLAGRDITPADRLCGLAGEIAAERDRKLEEARSRRRLKASENQLAIAS